ncbi:MAG: hypothetical protein HC827_19135 [Cyanobacteria bacterium RM1_2_2]|nr:hypothetical protein [Cyanobacteria bacterium RM1_2_2]
MSSATWLQPYILSFEIDQMLIDHLPATITTLAQSLIKWMSEWKRVQSARITELAEAMIHG